MLGPNLFDYADRFPHRPGYKRHGTSKDAAAKTRRRVAALRGAVLAMLNRAGPMTADECAAAIEESVLSVRPRFSELATLGTIVKTGERRPNSSGMSANVYAVTITPKDRGAT